MRLNLNLIEDKNNVFFISDFHLFHQNVIRFDNRPFTNLDEMHEAIIKGWNEVVEANDVVIYLGDLSFAKAGQMGEVKSILNRLNGTIHFVLGNHDNFQEIKKMPRFSSVNDYLEVRITHFSEDLNKIETLFCCMHYPIYSWNKAHHGTFMVHGHSHGNLHHGEDASFYVNRKVIDVGCMLLDYTPISYKEIMEKLKNVTLTKINK